MEKILLSIKHSWNPAVWRKVGEAGNLPYSARSYIRKPRLQELSQNVVGKRARPPCFSAVAMDAEPIPLPLCLIRTVSPFFFRTCHVEAVSGDDVQAVFVTIPVVREK